MSADYAESETPPADGELFDKVDDLIDVDGMFQQSGASQDLAKACNSRSGTRDSKCCPHAKGVKAGFRVGETVRPFGIGAIACIIPMGAGNIDNRGCCEVFGKLYDVCQRYA